MPPVKAVALLGSSLALAGGAGVFAAKAITNQSGQTPSRTVTISLTAGPQGPTGPQGPQGPPGAGECPTGFTFGVLVIDHPGGHVQIATCLAD